MESLYRLNTIKSLARAYWPIGGFLLLALMLLVIVRFQAEAYSFGQYNDDEYHTIYQGLNLLVNGHVDNFRAQESTRWLVRAFYPGALIYMNTHMGGNVYQDGWSYPGHDYVVRNYMEKISSSTTLTIDPNLRNLFHALRLQYILFVAACVLALLLFFYQRGYFLTAFGGVLLLGFNLDLLGEQKIFYIEPAMLAVLALFILAYVYYLYRGNTRVRSAVWLGLLGAFLVSTKFSAVFFLILPIILFVYQKGYRLSLRSIAVYLGALALGYLVINFPAFSSISSLNLFLHDLFSNFWQYGAGGDPGTTTAPGIAYLSLLTYQLEGLFGYALYLLPPLFIFALWYADKKERMILLPLTLLVGLSIFSLSGQHVYVVRNLIPFYVPLTIAALLSLEIVGRALNAKNPRFVAGGIAALAILWLAGVMLHAGGPSNFASQIIPNAKAGFIAELKLRSMPESASGIYAVGFSKNFFAGEAYEEKLIQEDSVPQALSSKNYPTLLSQYGALPKGSIVLVDNVGNNKHLVTYVLPKYFSENFQFGKYYAFFNPEQ